MAKQKEFNLEIDPNVNIIIDESRGNSFIALRKLRWSENSDFKLDIRKWYTNSEGEEIAGKGVSFMTDDGPANLIEALLENGYGDTRKTIRGVSSREDFPIAVKEVIEELGINLDSVEIPTIDTIEDFYDPKAIIG